MILFQIIDLSYSLISQLPINKYLALKIIISRMSYFDNSPKILLLIYTRLLRGSLFENILYLIIIRKKSIIILIEFTSKLLILISIRWEHYSVVVLPLPSLKIRLVVNSQKNGLGQDIKILPRKSILNH